MANHRVTSDTPLAHRAINIIRRIIKTLPTIVSKHAKENVWRAQMLYATYTDLAHSPAVSHRKRPRQRGEFAFSAAAAIPSSPPTRMISA